MGEPILIVEDEEKITRELELEVEGYTIIGKAKDGLEGLTAYRTGQWELMLLDVMLPGMSGIELLCRIKEELALKKIILVGFRSMRLMIGGAVGFGAVKEGLAAEDTPASNR